MFILFAPFDIVLVFPADRKVYKHEVAGGLYCPSAFFFARVLAEMPTNIISALIYIITIDTMAGFQLDGTHLLAQICIGMTLMLAASGLFLLCGSIAADFEEANLYALVVALLNLLLSGFYVNKENIPAGYRWMSEVQIMSHSVDAAAATELEGLTFTCTAAEEVNNLCPIVTGDLYLDSMNMGTVSWGESILYVAILAFVYHFLAFLGLKYLFTGNLNPCGGGSDVADFHSDESASESGTKPASGSDSSLPSSYPPESNRACC